jgi:hypothetical protein
VGEAASSWSVPVHSSTSEKDRHFKAPGGAIPRAGKKGRKRRVPKRRRTG